MSILLNDTINPPINAPYKGTPIPGAVLDLNMEYRGKKAIDYSGYGNDGTITGASPIVANSGYAMNFDGVDDVIVGNNNNGMKILPAVSIESWIRTASTGTIHITGSNIIMYYLTNNIIIYRRNYSVDYGAWGIPLPDSKWHHIVWTESVPNAPTPYLDGRQINPNPYHTPAGDPVIQSNYKWNIGASTYLTGYFNGSIGIVRVYNRVLTPTEVQYSYRQDAWRYGLGA